MTSCTNNPIGSDALWEGLDIFSCMTHLRVAAFLQEFVSKPRLLFIDKTTHLKPMGIIVEDKFRLIVLQPENLGTLGY